MMRTVRLLPQKELLAVLAAKNRNDLFVGGAVQAKTIVLYRGNLQSVTVPLAWFAPSGSGVRPNFSRFSIIDFGQTVKLGKYEAATDAILYDHDPIYCRRAKRRSQYV